MGELTNLNSRSIVDADIPAAIARDSEVTAAINAHTAAADPHAQYLVQSEGDARYPQFKRAIITSNCPTAANGTTFVSHGLQDSNIRAFSAFAITNAQTISETRHLPGGTSYITGNTNYSVDIGNGQVRIRLGTAAQSSGIFGAPITIVIDHV